MIYFDSSALVKLIHPEVGSAELSRWLDGRDQRWVSSALVEVEVPRALSRRAPHTLSAAHVLIADIACMEITASIRAIAAVVSDPSVRSLDAIHIATALEFGIEVRAFISYDQRLLTAAAAVGLPATSPGAVPAAAETP